jgi:hypothetical protein
MKTASILALALALAAVSGGVVAEIQRVPNAAQSLNASGPQANRIVGTWEFNVHLFRCDTGETLAQFRAASVYNAGGTMLDTNTAPPSTRGPAFGVWSYNRRTGEYSTSFRMYRYNPDGSFAGANEVNVTSILSADGNHMTGSSTGKILGPNEELLMQSCGTNEGVRSL